MDGAADSRTLSGGTMLDDKYRIERLLAAGGMGAVYLGTHIKLRKRVAIKVLNPQLSTAPMVERFHREAITASQIGHEGIAQVTDLGTSSEGEPFLVMEYLEGESLAARLAESGRLAVEDACELGCSILSPLAAAHRAGIVHRDLKPDNVFLVRQSRGEMVKLLDFGISRTAGLEPTFRLTMTGLVLGTPYYMSPEQARGESEITPAADLYAFGVILYEMLIGDVPIRAENYNALMYRVTMGDFARPRALRPELPREIERLILQAMAQTPGDRPVSADALEQALLKFCRPVFREHVTGRTAPGVALKALLGQRTSDAMNHAKFAGPTVPGDSHVTPPPVGDTLQDPVLSALTASDELDELSETSSREPHDSRAADHPTVLDHHAADGHHAADSPTVLDHHAAVDHHAGFTNHASLDGHAAPAAYPVLTAAASSAAPSPIGPPRRSRRARLLTGLAITVAGIAAAGSLVLVLGDRGSPPGAVAPVLAPRSGGVAGDPVVAPPAPPAPPAATSGSATGPGDKAAGHDATTITLRFAVEPSEAAITLDGTRLEATELAVTRDAVPHRLRITAAGYASHEQIISFDESQQLFVQLKHAGRPGGKGAHIERTRIERPERPATERPERTEQTDRADRIEKDSPYK